MNTRNVLAVIGALSLAPLLIASCNGESDGGGTTPGGGTGGSMTGGGGTGAPNTGLNGLGAVQRGRPLSEWIAEIEGDDRFKSFRAINVVADMQERGLPAVPAIRARLLSPDSDEGIKRQSMRALGRIGGPDAIAALLKTMTDGDEIIGILAADALGALGAQAVEPLTPYLKHKNADVRDRTGRALKGALAAQGRNGQLDVAVVPLAEALVDEDTRVRAWSMQILSELGARALAAKPLLIEQLDRDIPNDQRLLVLVILGLMGPDAADAIPQLRAATTHEDTTVQLFAGLALAQVGAVDEGVGLLIDLLENGSEAVQLGAADALRRVGPKAEAAIPALKNARRGASEKMHLTLDQALRAVQGRP